MVDLIDKARRKGMRITPQRIVVCDVLEASDDHPDADTLHARCRVKDDTISLASIYRTLKMLEGFDFVHRHDFGDGRQRYEVNNHKHHDHLVDLDTGEVIEFHNQALEQLKESIAREHGYRLEGHTLALYCRSDTR